MDLSSTNPQSPLPILPPEVVELIVDQLAFGLDNNEAAYWPRFQLRVQRKSIRQTLIAFRGLSRFFCAITSRYIFRDIEIRFDTRHGDQRAGTLYNFVWSDASNILRHIQNASITLPDLPLRRQAVFDDVRAWLSSFLDYASSTIPSNDPTQLLASLRIGFLPDKDLVRRWTQFDDSMQTLLCAVCQSKVLTRRFVFVRVHNLPRSLFQYAGARVLELVDTSADTGSELPGPSDSLLVPDSREKANVEEVITNWGYAFHGLDGVRVLRIVAPETNAFACVSQWTSSLEELVVPVFSMSSRRPGNINELLASRLFPRLQRIDITNLDFMSCTCRFHQYEGRRTETVSFNPYFGHLVTFLNNLTDNENTISAPHHHQNAPSFVV